MFTFFTLLKLVKLFKSIGVGIIYIGQWGGGEGLMLVEVELFSGVGGGGVIFSGKLIFFMRALIISWGEIIKT